jgi:hypothetical protein
MSWKFKRHKDGYEVTTRKRIDSIAVFLKCIKENWKKWRGKSKKMWEPQERLPWFRGSEKDKYELIPSIYRGKKTIGWEYYATEAEDMKAEFARRAAPFLKEHQHFREGEYLHLMQHYKYPTRLLDWTEGALIALYFAIRAIDTKDRVESPCVWMLNPSWLNYVNDVTIAHPETNEDKSLVLYTDQWAMEKYDQDQIIFNHYLDSEHNLAKYPIAIFPPYIDVRIVAQKSVFTINGKLKNGFEALMHEKPNAQIAKILITEDKKKIKKLIKDLQILGITETTLFPDLEGLSRELQEEYKMRVKYP